MILFPLRCRCLTCWRTQTVRTGWMWTWARTRVSCHTPSTCAWWLRPGTDLTTCAWCGGYRPGRGTPRRGRAPPRGRAGEAPGPDSPGEAADRTSLRAEGCTRRRTSPGDMDKVWSTQRWRARQCGIYRSRNNSNNRHNSNNQVCMKHL